MAIQRSEESLDKLPDIAQPEDNSPHTAARVELRGLVEQAVSLRYAEKRLGEIKKRIAQIVRDQAFISEDGKLWGFRDGVWGTAVVVRDQTGRKTLSREKLIEAGVTPAQIDASWTTGAGYTVVEIIAPD